MSASELAGMLRLIALSLNDLADELIKSKPEPDIIDRAQTILANFL